MDRLTASALADVLLATPTWARLGLAVRDQRLRERAADCIAATIVERLDPPEKADGRPLVLSL